MIKLKPLLVMSVTLVIIGIVISLYQSSLANESIASEQQSLPVGGTLAVSKFLNSSGNKVGVYAIQISDFKQGDSASVNVFDPFNATIITKDITKSSFQENFTLSSTGSYSIQIHNTSGREMQVLGIIGYYPEAATLLDLLGFLILIIGLSGLAIGLIYLIKRRGKPNVN